MSNAESGQLAEVKKFDRTNRKVVAMALVLPIKKATGDGESHGLSNPWEDLSDMQGTVEPPLDPLALAMLEENSSELRQCIEAYEVNIPGFGWRVRPLKASAKVPELEAAIEAEKDGFDEFLKFVDYDEKSFTNLRRRTRHDLEGSGNAYWEIVRDSAGVPCAYRLIPHWTMRLTPVDEEVVEVVRRRPTGKGAARTWKDVRLRKRFRKFVQARALNRVGGSEVIFFKEYGDPRAMDDRDGEFKDPKEIPPEHLATEIFHWKIYNSRTPYGLPRYVGNLLAIFGSRKSEEINFTTFTNNLIPSMALMVSNGEVTDDTIARIQAFSESQIQGSDNYSKFLILEAQGLDEDSPDVVKMDLKPLVREQHTDELFQNYDGNNREKVRQSFRLPPIFVGRSDDYTRATAETSRALADEQVFDPERKDEDHEINRLLVDMGMLHCEFVTNTPNVTNDTNLINVMNGAEKAGAMTPRIGRAILEDVLNTELEGFADGFDPDAPFSLTMAEAVKNQAKPNEVGQQVTALKDAVEATNLDWIDRIQNALTLRLSESDASPHPNVALNAGSQAQDLSDGFQRAYLSSIALNLAGREMLVSDGRAVLARARFGTSKRLGIDRAAVIAGLDIADVRAMFPGRVEVYAVPVEARNKIEPVYYEHPDDSLFTVVAPE